MCVFFVVVVSLFCRPSHWIWKRYTLSIPWERSTLSDSVAWPESLFWDHLISLEKNLPISSYLAALWLAGYFWNWAGRWWSSGSVCRLPFIHLASVFSRCLCPAWCTGVWRHWFSTPLPPNKAPVSCNGRGKVGSPADGLRFNLLPWLLMLLPSPLPLSASCLVSPSVALSVSSYDSSWGSGIDFLISSNSLIHISASQVCGHIFSVLPPFSLSLLPCTHFSMVSE